MTRTLLFTAVPGTVDDLTGEHEITLPAGLPGFADVHRFSLERLDEDVPLFLLRGLENETAEFVVVPPSAFFPEYAPLLDDATVEQLGLSTADDAVLLVVLTFREPPEVTTANLMAPVVVNRRTRVAAQAVLTGSPYALREPLPVG